MKKSIILLLAFICGVTAQAFNYTYHGQTVNYAIADNAAKTCVVRSGVQGVGPAIGNNLKGELIIPDVAEYNGEFFTVIGIGEYAFLNCEGLTAVSIPHTVVSIGTNAFSGCGELLKAEFASVEDLCRINFESASSNPLEYAGALYINGREVSELVIPESVTSIGQHAFRGCSELVSVKIPTSLTAVGVDAFNGCYGLKRAEFANLETLFSISFATRYDNPLHYSHHLYVNGQELTNIVIPEGVTQIGNYIFSGCTAIKSVVLPSSTTQIGESAFEGCSSLTDIVIPESVTIIDKYAFSRCTALTMVALPGIVSIGDYAFAQCNELHSLILSPSVESISTSAFYGINGINKVVVPQYLEYDFGSASVYTYNPDDAAVDNSGFVYTRDRKGLLFAPSTISGKFTIPSEVDYIGANAFAKCNTLARITIPGNVKMIYASAFNECNGLGAAEYDSEETMYSIQYSNLQANPLYYAHHLYVAGSEITDLVIPESITSIKPFTFAGCSGLTSVTFGTRLTEIGSNAFSNCTGLQSLVIPASIELIGAYAFGRCTAMVSADIEAPIRELPTGIFYGCTNLSRIDLPTSLDVIGDNAFSGCKALKSISLPGGLNAIGNKAFDGCSALQTLDIPDSVTSVGSDVTNNSGVRSIILGTGVIPESNCVFNGFYLSKIAVSTSVPEVFTNSYVIKVNYNSDDYIVDNACIYSADKCAVYFAHVTITDEYQIPESVSAIKPNAFARCQDLTSVTVPTGVTEIGKYAWGDCTGIISVECLSPNPCTAPTDIFTDNVYSAATLYVPEGCVATYMVTEPWSNFYNITDQPKLAATDSIETDITGQIDYSMPYKVYNTQGISIGDTITNLPTGIYILLQGTTAVKISL